MESLIGNAEIKTLLKRLAARDQVGNTLLFAGPRGVGKGLFARAFARELLGGAELDLCLLQPAGRAALHSIDAIRNLSELVHLPPTVSKRKVFIIDEADRLPSVSANALLKTFEEPPEDTLIILVTSLPHTLPPTVRSRCRELTFSPVSEEEIAGLLRDRYQKEPQTASRLARQAVGSVGRAIRLAEEGADSPTQRMVAFLPLLPRATYYDLSQTAAALAASMEALREEMVRQANKIVRIEWVTGVQREELEKEAEGAAAQLFFQEVDYLLEIVATWYCDLFLIEEQKRKEISSCRWERTDWAVRRCQAAVRKFSKLAHTLELLFLELQTI
jgi:DNA polymerase III subunit delta'